MKHKVINLFTRKPLEVDQDMEKNDEISSEGEFIGSIHPSTAAVIRAHQADVEVTGEQIDYLMGEYLHMLDTHNQNIQEVLGLLKVRDYDPDKHVIMISDDGKVWKVEREPGKYMVTCRRCGAYIGTSEEQVNAICKDCYNEHP